MTRRDRELILVIVVVGNDALPLHSLSQIPEIGSFLFPTKKVSQKLEDQIKT